MNPLHSLLLGSHERLPWLKRFTTHQHIKINFLSLRTELAKFLDSHMQKRHLNVPELWIRENFSRETLPCKYILKEFYWEGTVNSESGVSIALWGTGLNPRNILIITIISLIHNIYTSFWHIILIWYQHVKQFHQLKHKISLLLGACLLFKLFGNIAQITMSNWYPVCYRKS